MKVCLITGAGGAIGKPLAIRLASEGYRLVVTGRNATKAAELADEIRQASGSEAVEPLGMDLSSLQSVRDGAAEFLQRFERCDLLINNAAVYYAKRQTTRDGFEALFGVNHLAPFLLTNLLLERVQATPGARILFVSMDTGTAPDFDDLLAEKKYNPLNQLGMVKACNIRTALHLSHKLKGTGIGVFAVNPAMTKTTLVKEAPAPLRLIFSLVGAKPETAAGYLHHVATSPSLEGKSGKFFSKDKKLPPPKTTDDPKINAKLWKLSEQLVGLA